MEKVLRYFAGGNTARGFHSLYDTNLADLKKLFILKGKSTITKSTIISEIGESFGDKGFRLEYFHNALHPALPEGVIIREIGVGIVDGGYPRKIMPKLSQTEVRYIDLSAVHRDSLSEAEEVLIEERSEQIGLLIQQAHEAFKAALHIHDEWEAIYIDQMDFDKADEMAEKMINDLLGTKHRDRQSHVYHRYLGAATPEGAFDFVPVLTETIQNRYFIKGRPGSGKSTMLKKLAAESEKRGFDTEIYHCGFDPHSLDMVIVRELGTAFFDSTAPHEYYPSREGDAILDVYEHCIQSGTDEVYEEEIKHIARRYRQKMDAATALLAKAKELDDINEKVFAIHSNAHALAFAKKRILSGC